MQASLVTGGPGACGILTPYTDAQAAARSADDAHNKGREAAAACAETVAILQRIARGD